MIDRKINSKSAPVVVGVAGAGFPFPAAAEIDIVFESCAEIYSFLESASNT